MSGYTKVKVTEKYFCLENNKKNVWCFTSYIKNNI